MKRFFTLSVFFNLFAFMSLAQGPAFRVDSPGGIEGFYPFALAAFGSGIVNDISGELVFADDGSAAPTEGCNALTNDLSGKIAIIDRGSCEFGVKCLNAQNAGAIAVIVCNNAAENEDRGGLITMAGGAVGDQVTLPCIFLTKESCATIRMEIPGATVSFLSQYDPNEVAVWGTNSGEGDFNQGLNAWTTQGISGSASADAVWEYDPMGSAAKGGFASDEDFIISPSSNNGAMVFNSDFLDNGGDSTATNMGVSPAPHAGELISPDMDLSAVAEVSLRFNQYYKNRNSTTSIATSTDGGVSWSDPIPVNENIEAEQATERRNIQTIYLPGLGGSATAKVKFIFEGSLHFWIVDDVKVIEAELHSSSLSAFLFPPSNYGTPVSMIEGDSMFFSTLISNNGLQDITNVKMTGQVIGGESILIKAQKLKRFPPAIRIAQCS